MLEISLFAVLSPLGKPKLELQWILKVGNWI